MHNNGIGISNRQMSRGQKGFAVDLSWDTESWKSKRSDSKPREGSIKKKRPMNVQLKKGDNCILNSISSQISSIWSNAETPFAGIDRWSNVSQTPSSNIPDAIRNEDELKGEIDSLKALPEG